MNGLAETDAKGIWRRLKHSADGLVPVIAVSADNGRVLMLAYMDEEALTASLQSGYMHYHSRSRNELWFKGETSGNTQEIASCAVDCDADTLMFTIHANGPACHTGQETCFYRDLQDLLTEAEA